ncbi:MAG TPA: hypothetical protein VIH85_27285 [Solirubrobacteraceae bacterium]|jgi:hypothetical protein
MNRTRFSVPRERRKTRLEDRAIAHILAPWLDRELADGMAPSASEAHAARAQQLCGDRVRHSVARSLEALLDRAENPRPAALRATVPLCAEQIRDAAALIASTAGCLRSREALDPGAVARLKILLADRRGPCYRQSRRDALTVALREIGCSPGARGDGRDPQSE